MTHPTAQPTPTPWTISRYSNYHGFAIYGPDGFGCVAERWEDSPDEDRNAAMHANADLIVRAVNSHALLVAALQSMLSWAERCGPGSVPAGSHLVRAQAIESARSALREAKGGA